MYIYIIKIPILTINYYNEMSVLAFSVSSTSLKI